LIEGSIWRDLFAIINLPSMGTWALFGAGLRQFLQVKRNLVIFNYGMAGLLLASLYPLLHAPFELH
jgi:threonine/homoserine/homoserine lactone efflux protein